MRFNNTKGIPFSKWLANANKNEIKEVLYKFGDEKHAKLIASEIDAAKKNRPILNTLELSNIIKDVYPEKNNKIHPATKSFQAFRILINNELDELSRSLKNAGEIIKRNGYIVTIAFHSLEDNIIKNFFRPSIKSYPKDIPINNEEKKKYKCIAKKIRASEDEINKNPRSRSAIMRVFQKI